jgi:salicylate hydroxylase
MRVLIAGGGIGGLASALALARQGCEVEVYEQAPELKEVGAGLQLSPNGTRVLYALGVGEALRALSCEAEGKEIRIWNTGECWKLFDLGAVAIERYGYPYFTVYRPDLLSVLAHALQRERPGAIRLSSKAVGFMQDRDRVALHFENGETAYGDVLVGADGVHSRIRQALFGPDQPKFTGIIAWRGVIPIEKLPRHMVRMVGTNWVGPGGHVVHYPLRGGEVMNFVYALERSDWQIESWSARGTQEELLNDVKGWHEDVQTLVRNIPTPFKWALMVRAPMERWSVGRVTLLGDACHSMLPFLGQGANSAIEDGFILARALTELDLDIPWKLERYERARRDRTRRAVEGSADNIHRFHNKALADPVKAREHVSREWAGEPIAERYEWIFRYDATTVEI